MIRSAAGQPAACPAYLAGRRGGDLIDLDLLWLAAYLRFLLGQVPLRSHLRLPPPLPVSLSRELHFFIQERGGWWGGGGGRGLRETARR